MTVQKVIIILLCGLACLALSLTGLSFFNEIGCEGQLAIASEHPTDSQEIRGEQRIGQSFVAPHNGLNRIDLHLQTYERQNTQDVIFSLLELPHANLSEGKEVFSTQFNASTVTNSAWRTFEIPPIPDSAQKTYLLVLHSPTSEPGDAITVSGVQQNIYQPGTAYLGSMPVPADITFRSCYQMTPVEKLQVLGEQMTRQRPGWWGNPYFYLATILLYGLLAAGFFWKLVKLEW
jgi:hypothetical protein